MSIIGALPNNIINGQAIDAVPVMANFNWIMNQVNANAPSFSSLGIQTSASITCTASGTSDAIVGSFTPAITAIANGMTLFVRASAANTTTTPTFTPSNGVIAAKTIVREGGVAVAAGDIHGAGHWLFLTYDLSLDKWVLGNPAASTFCLGNAASANNATTATSCSGNSATATNASATQFNAPGSLAATVGSQGFSIRSVANAANTINLIQFTPNDQLSQKGAISADNSGNMTISPASGVLYRGASIIHDDGNTKTVGGQSIRGSGDIGIGVPLDAANSGIQIGCFWATATVVTTVYTPGTTYALNGTSRCVSSVAIYSQQFYLFQRIA